MEQSGSTFATPIEARLDEVDWSEFDTAIDADGYAILPRLVDAENCERLAGTYSEDDLFRSRVVMGRHGFGRGEYKYFAYPLPPPVAELRRTLYPRVALIANRWNEQLGRQDRYPENLTEYVRRCHLAGQQRPTPLLLQYGEGDFNCLHQDLYGDLYFPLQAIVLLSKPDIDFEGGELVITETRSADQSISVIPLRQGDAVIVPVNERPVPGRRGTRRVEMRHGVSRVRSGSRHTLGIIFHDAR